MDASRPQRKRLAHHSPVERHNEPIILFVTLAVQPRGEFLTNPVIHEAFLHACVNADAWSVGYYLIMPDHVHFFCSPAQWPRVALLRWVRYLKERITKRLGEVEINGGGSPQVRPPGEGNVGGRGCAEPLDVVRPWRWQSECWDTQMRNESRYHEKWEYVRLNPVRKRLVLTAEAWTWQGELHILRW